MFTSIEESQKRLELCKSCENYISSITMCSICHCIMPLKTKIADLSCPIGKWNAVLDKKEENNIAQCCPPADTPIVFIPAPNDEI